MNVETIKMNQSKAHQQFLDYRELVRARHSHEDEAIMRGYRALSQGKTLIDASAAIAKAGVDKRFLPKLAISRADFKTVFYHGWRDGSGRFSLERWPRSRTIRGGVFEMKPGTLPLFEGENIESKAIVPIIPARLRPQGSLKRFHVLWEADWEAVPRDPMLLRHLGGFLFTVLAVWDLSEIERAVLRGTRQTN